MPRNNRTVFAFAGDGSRDSEASGKVIVVSNVGCHRLGGYGFPDTMTGCLPLPAGVRLP